MLFQVSVDGEMVKSSELFNQELLLPDLKVRTCSYHTHMHYACVGPGGAIHVICVAHARYGMPIMIFT